MLIGNKEYVVGQDRNEPDWVAHLYDGNFSDPGNPLCVRGWNRDGGFGYSIFRNNWGDICKVCFRRALLGLDGVEPRDRKTKWL